MSRRQRSLLIRTLLFLFILNAISFSIYLLLSSPSPEPLAQPQTLTLTLKPWPTLPSFLPWTNPNPNPPPRSCEAYFGNGFSNRIQVVGSDSGGSGGFLRCFYSETLRSSIWEMGRVRMDPGRILMSRGGERLDEVIGREEEEELPKFEEAAFEIEGEDAGDVGRAVDDEFLDKYVPRGQIQQHTMRALVDSVRVVEPGKLDCSEVNLWCNDCIKNHAAI